MMSLDELATIAREHKLRFPVSREAIQRSVASSALALFHEPLLAMVIATIVRHRKDDLRASEASVWAAATLANCYFGLRTQHRLMLEWSATFRERCAGALVILETLTFVEVSGSERRLLLSAVGKETMRGITARPDDTGVLARRLAASCADAFRLGLDLL